MRGAKFGDQAARTGRAELFVRVDEHGKSAVFSEVHRLENRQGVENDGDSLLVVGDSQAVNAIAFDAKGLLCQHAARVHRVHVRDEQDFLIARPSEGCPHHLADFLGRVFHLVDVARLDQLDLAAQLFQPRGDKVCELVESFAVTAAGLNGHQSSQGFEQGGLFLLHQRQYRLAPLAE